MLPLKQIHEKVSIAPGFSDTGSFPIKEPGVYESAIDFTPQTAEPLGLEKLHIRPEPFSGVARIICRENIY